MNCSDRRSVRFTCFSSERTWATTPKRKLLFRASPWFSFSFRLYRCRESTHIYYGNVQCLLCYVMMHDVTRGGFVDVIGTCIWASRWYCMQHVLNCEFPLYDAEINWSYAWSYAFINSNNNNSHTVLETVILYIMIWSMLIFRSNTHLLTDSILVFSQHWDIIRFLSKWIICHANCKKALLSF